jgi:hypothetical protein
MVRKSSHDSSADDIIKVKREDFDPDECGADGTILSPYHNTYPIENPENPLK